MKVLAHNYELSVVLILVGVLSNRTFLAWTSSSLETAPFNFCITLWITIAVLGYQRSDRWLFGLTTSAALVYLARPEGLLVPASTLFLSALSLVRRYRTGKLRLISLPALLPLIVPVIHLVWRRSFYGEWLPNTYYAKHVAAWPEPACSISRRLRLSMPCGSGCW